MKVVVPEENSNFLKKKKKNDQISIYIFREFHILADNFYHKRSVKIGVKILFFFLIHSKDIITRFASSQFLMNSKNG